MLEKHVPHATKKTKTKTCLVPRSNQLLSFFPRAQKAEMDKRRNGAGLESKRKPSQSSVPQRAKQYGRELSCD